MILYCKTCEDLAVHSELGKQSFPGRVLVLWHCDSCGNDQAFITRVDITELLRLARVYQATSRELLNQSQKFSNRVARLLDLIEGALPDENGLHD